MSDRFPLGTYAAAASFAGWTVRHEQRRAALFMEKPHLSGKLRPLNLGLVLDATDSLIRAARVLVAWETLHA